MANVPSAAVLSAAVDPAPWSTLDPNLDPDNASALPAFPVDCLPGDWARWVRDAAALSGALPDHVALGLFAAIAGMTGAGVAAQPIPGWREPLVLWQCAVGPSGPMRSAALGAGRALIDALDDDDEDQAEPRQRVVGEGTLKTVAKVVSRNPNGVVMWRDELAAWMPRGPKPRAAWQEAWSAQPLVVINSGNEARQLRLKRFPVSVIGGLSPGLLPHYLKGADDGFASRFLYAWPAAVPWTPLAERPRPDNDAAMKLRLLRNSLGTDDEPLTLVFESEAVGVFEAFCRTWHAPAGRRAIGRLARQGGEHGGAAGRGAAAAGMDGGA